MAKCSCIIGSEKDGRDLADLHDEIILEPYKMPLIYFLIHFYMPNGCVDK